MSLSEGHSDRIHRCLYLSGELIVSVSYRIVATQKTVL
jgi:hypothetical protein